jgi:superfamily II DNA or RNA helicase
MGPQHSRTTYWTRKGVFDSLSSFQEFEARVNAIHEEKDRGDVFEIFVEGYLATQNISQHARHWVVGRIPPQLRESYNLPRDVTGIDGIYETHSGSQVAYQVKYRQRGHLTFAEVAPFLGITEKFVERVIFTNATRLSQKAVARTRWVSGDVFHDLSEAALHAIEAWIKAKKVPVERRSPDPRYQVQALADIKEVLKQNDRATIVMACGTGKTLVALWAAEEQKPKTVLVLLPSLTLLQQTLREWSEHTSWGDRFTYLCVCSDKTVAGEDVIATDTTEMEFPVRTDPKIVRRFLQQTSRNVKVIFSTYQSSPIIGKGAKGLPPIDIAIFDEAHKTTGLSGSAFGFALSDKNIRIHKRLFLTATPRHLDIRKRNDEGDFRTLSMDDEGVYGPRAHTLSFAGAVKLGIICRYKVIISLIDKEMVDDFTRKNGITLVKKDEVSARWMANLIAVQRAIETVKAQKIITFHSRVRLAREFATNAPRGVAHHLKNFDVRHVNGAQSSADRSDTIKAFASSKNGLLTNARCLTEGVNIPAVDMVAFVDPRQSRIDITQAVGRAMRKPRGKSMKTVGYVVVPLFAGMGKNDTLDDAIKSEKFAAVADVLNALQEHDEELSSVIREIRQRKGVGDKFNPGALADTIEIIGPRVSFDRLAKSIGVEVAERLGSSWDEWFGVLLKFQSREGHVRVSVEHSEDGRRLGGWVFKQRQMRSTLSVERSRQLDSIGFDWSPLTTQWTRGLLELQSYKSSHGDCLVPRDFVQNGFNLGQWVVNRRSDSKNGMPKEKVQELDAVGFVWSLKEASWLKYYLELKKYNSDNGDCDVPRSYFADGLDLGGWVNRIRHSQEKLLKWQVNRLKTIGFVWKPLFNRWALGYEALQEFFERHGHSNVPRDHVVSGFALGRWVSSIRRRKSSLSPHHVSQLKALDFSWNIDGDQWEKYIDILKGYVKEHGDALVPRSYVVHALPLGMWVSRQRLSRDLMDGKRLSQLSELGFVWNPHEIQWLKMFSLLKVFVEREGHCRVPTAHMESGRKLGGWVDTQRQNRYSMSKTRKVCLNSVNFVWRVR